jgi:hypothetical protein
VSNEIKGIAAFVRKLPPGSRVMVGYLQLGLAARAAEVHGRPRTRGEVSAHPVSSPAVSPYNPFALTRDAVKRFESQPVGRRAFCS